MANMREPQPTAILAEITADLAAGSDLRSLLQRFLEPVKRLAGAQAGAVRVLSEGDGRLQLVSDVGLPQHVRCAERSMDRHCGVCGVAAAEDRVASSTDLRVCFGRTHDRWFGSRCARVLAVPMAYRGRVLGVYNLFFAGGAEPGAEIVGVLKSIGELLGLALHNARLERENLRATLTQERQMLAAEVHDSLAQTLAFVKMRMPLLQEAVIEHDDEHALKYVADVREAVGEAHACLREIIDEFRSPVDPHGLVPALQACAATFRRRCDATLELVDHGGAMALSAAQQAQAVQVVREALANVAKHALADRVRLALALRGEKVEIVVEDDGAGLATPESPVSHHGLDIMRERARRLGGSLEIGPRQGGGTRVRLQFPLHPVARGGPS
jgi:two-component system nitrate/nitrite sensor histidine kinase NarX